MTDQEVWKSIPGYEPDYEVSNLGRVKSLKFSKARILSQNYGRFYLRVLLSKNNKKRLWRVHQLVALAFLGSRPKGLVVCHNDGNGRNNKVGNLRYDTQAANINDAIKHGTFKKVFLSDDDIKDIQNEYNIGLMPIKKLARKYKVHSSRISKIVSRVIADKRHSKQKEIVRLRERYARGNCSLLGLANEYGLSESFVSLVVNGLRHKDIDGPIKGIDY